VCLAALDQCFPWEVIIEPVVGILLSSTVFRTASIAPNSRYFEGLLLVFDSDYSGVCTLAADDHLSDYRCRSRIEPPSMRPIFEVTEGTN